MVILRLKRVFFNRTVEQYAVDQTSREFPGICWKHVYSILVPIFISSRNAVVLVEVGLVTLP